MIDASTTNALNSNNVENQTGDLSSVENRLPSRALNEDYARSPMPADFRSKIASYKAKTSAKLSIYVRVQHVVNILTICFISGAMITAGMAGWEGERIAEIIPGGWQILCYASALLAFLAAVLQMLVYVYPVPELIVECKHCLVELENLLDSVDDDLDVKGKVQGIRKIYYKILAGID